MIKITCDAHGWMHAWWVATDTPYFAVTDDKGNYSIAGVPPGEHQVEVWQEKLGTEDQKVEVKDGATANGNFFDEAEGLSARMRRNESRGWSNPAPFFFAATSLFTGTI